MRALLSLVALASLGWAGDPQGLVVRPWLEKGGVSGVAVLLVPEGCAGCEAEAERFGRLRARFGDRGLRALVLAEASEATCERPEWADEVRCGGGKVFSAYGAPKSRPTGLLWDWQGRLRATGGARQIEQLARALRSSVYVETSGSDARDLRAALELAVRGTGKLHLRPRPGRPLGPTRRCPRGHEASGRLGLVARSTAGRLDAQLVDTAAGCHVAEVKLGLTARDVSEVAREAVGRLIYPLISDPEVPNLGAAVSAPVGQRPARGVLVDPEQGAGRPAVAVPVEAPPLGPVAPVPGGLVDPSRQRAARAGQSLADFAAAWVGTRYALGGDDRSGIDDKHLAQLAFETVYGIDLTSDLARQLRSGPEVAFDPEHPERDLVPGDLLFYVSYAYLPRSVMIYLGGGKILSSQVIRGVVIDDAPSSVPEYLYLVARRPLAGALPAPE